MNCRLFTTAATVVALAIAVPAAVAGNDQGEDGAVPVAVNDSCDPATFNAVLGAGACVGSGTVTFGAFIGELSATHKVAAWNFSPSTLTITKGERLVVSNRGGETHTFTEVAQFGGGFVEGLNHGEATVPECSGGFANLAVARTRLVQGSTMELTNLPKGKHHFQCCIHPWMRMDVEVE